jgi:hypothetical protein
MKKNNFLKLLWISAVFLLFFVATSCKTSKKVEVKKTLKNYGFNYLKQKMDSNRLVFNYLSAKSNVKYDNGKSVTNLKTQLRIRQDSLIWISFSPAMGIEAARLELSCDSIKFINRLNKTYIADKYIMLDTLINSSVDYLILQSMILGSDSPFYEIENYKVRDGDGYYLLIMEKKRKERKNVKKSNTSSEVLVEKVWLDPDTFRARKLEMHELDNTEKKLVVYYDDYRLVQGRWFPYKLKIKIKSEKSLVVEINYNKVNFVNHLSFPFKIPSKYEKAL